MKIFTLAAAVEEKKFDPNEPFQSGSYRVTSKDKTIHDHNNTAGERFPILKEFSDLQTLRLQNLQTKKLVLINSVSI